MAKTIRNGYPLAPSAGETLHTHPGRLLGVLISNAQTSVQYVIFYDNTAASGTKVLTLALPAGCAPFYVQFPRDAAPAFGTGLHAVTTVCDVLVWSVDHG